MRPILWQLLNEAAEFLAGFLVLAGGIALLLLGLPIVAAVLGVE